MMTSGGLGGVMISKLAQSAADVGSYPVLGALFVHVNHPMTLDAMIRMSLYAVRLVNLPSVSAKALTVGNFKH